MLWSSTCTIEEKDPCHTLGKNLDKGLGDGIRNHPHLVDTLCNLSPKRWFRQVSCLALRSWTSCRSQNRGSNFLPKSPVMRYLAQRRTANPTPKAPLSRQADLWRRWAISRPAAWTAVAYAVVCTVVFTPCEQPDSVCWLPTGRRRRPGRLWRPRMLKRFTLAWAPKSKNANSWF